MMKMLTPRALTWKWRYRLNACPEVSSRKGGTVLTMGMASVWLMVPSGYPCDL